MPEVVLASSKYVIGCRLELDPPTGVLDSLRRLLTGAVALTAESAYQCTIDVRWCSGPHGYELRRPKGGDKRGRIVTLVCSQRNAVTAGHGLKR